MRKSEALFVDYGTTHIPILLEYSRRRTLGITVTPNKQVTITAPLDESLEKILQKITGRAGWISKQLRKFEAYQRILMPRFPEYISGETFYYLGRKYRLKLMTGVDDDVRLYGTHLRVTINRKEDQERIAKLIMAWYTMQAKELFNERFERFKFIWKREKIVINKLLVRKLEKRWGSCTEKGNIMLNLSLAQAPIQCIDYVLVHEICHLKYLNHGPQFYRMLEKYMPDWEKRKRRLEGVRLL